MSAHKFVQVEVVKPHDGHKKGASLTLREDIAEMQIGFGWVKRSKKKGAADAEDDGGIQGGPGTGSEASAAGGPEDGGQAG